MCGEQALSGISTTHQKGLDPNFHMRVPSRYQSFQPREAPEQLAWGLAFPEAPLRVPDVPVVSREHRPQLEKIQEVLPSRLDEEEGDITNALCGCKYVIQHCVHLTGNLAKRTHIT